MRKAAAQWQMNILDDSHLVERCNAITQDRRQYRSPVFNLNKCDKTHIIIDVVGEMNKRTGNLKISLLQIIVLHFP